LVKAILALEPSEFFSEGPSKIVPSPSLVTPKKSKQVARAKREKTLRAEKANLERRVEEQEKYIEFLLIERNLLYYQIDQSLKLYTETLCKNGL
jgi:hypothetical protein